jgi:hypothetical protein
LRIIAFTGLVCAGALAFGLAANAAPADTKGSGKPAAVDRKDDPDRIICKAPEATGSRLPSARQCKSKREWDEQSQRDRAALEKNQVQPFNAK